MWRGGDAIYSEFTKNLQWFDACLLTRATCGQKRAQARLLAWNRDRRDIGFYRRRADKARYQECPRFYEKRSISDGAHCSGASTPIYYRGRAFIVTIRRKSGPCARFAEHPLSLLRKFNESLNRVGTIRQFCRWPAFLTFRRIGLADTRCNAHEERTKFGTRF